jgi:integrase
LRAGYISTKIQKTGGVDRKPITQELDEELNRWLACYGANRHYYPVGGLPNTHLLVPSYTIDPQGGLHLRPLQKLTHPHRLVQRAIASLDLPTEGEGFHTLRRSSARAFFEQLRQSSNADHALMVVKSFLNHKNVSQTEHYLGISTERVLRDEALRGQSFLTRHTEATESVPGTITLRGVESA